MSKVLVTEQHLEDIADAIRGKNGTIATYRPEDMAEAIEDLEVYPEPYGTKSITANGVVSVKDYEFADVDVAGIVPTGNINITDMQSTDVTNYATAQVVDANLVAGNIKKDVNILGVVGT